MHMRIMNLNSVSPSIESEKDVQATKQPCFPVPYEIVAVERISHGTHGYIPCVRLKNIKGEKELRRCDEIVKPKAKEPIDLYITRVECELTYKEVNGYMVL